jgi:hypothetical protein
MARHDPLDELMLTEDDKIKIRKHVAQEKERHSAALKATHEAQLADPRNNAPPPASDLPKAG